MKVICITGKRGAGDAIDTFSSQGIPFDFYATPAVYENPVRHGIKLAHVNALNLAKKLGLSESVIVEDDVELTSKKSIEMFNECRYLAKELGFDIILGGAHHYESKDSGVLLEAVKLSGMHLYAVLNDKVDFSLCPKNEHIDNWVGKTYKVAVCNPMIAIQRIGWSEHHRSEVDYTEMFNRYDILRDNP